MLQAIVIFFLLLVSGPIIAYLVMAVGCVIPWHFLDAWCDDDAPFTFVIISLIVWLGFGVIWAIDLFRNYFAIQSSKLLIPTKIPLNPPLPKWEVRNRKKQSSLRL
jgi:hypothetical protein